MTLARKPQVFLFWALLVVVSLFCGGHMMLSYYTKMYIKEFYKWPAKRAPKEQRESMTKLMDDMLAGLAKPNIGRSIFFHDTSHSDPQTDTIFNVIKPTPVRCNFINLTARAACAVESAALHNPNLDVFVLFASPVYWNNATTNPITNAILSYPNIRLRNLNLWSYAAGTPVEQWFNTDELFRSRYLASHMSDFLRYLTLWRFGGTYLDMGVVVLKSLEELPPNYVGAESVHALNSAVLNFGYDDIGRKVAEYSLHDFQHNFNGRDWGNNGPGVITRTLKHVCQTDQMADMFDKERCQGFQVYQQDFFYVVHWREWSDFFDENKTESTLKRIQKSFVAHVWNKHSKKRKVRRGDRSAYGKLAAEHCPKVFASLSEYF